LSSNKSFSTETANRYALALFELANENSELDVVEKNIQDLLQIYNSSSDLKNFIKNPTQSQFNQLKVIQELSSKMNL
jgi:F-type H+-transporting ATPase subunit delta